MESAQNKLSFLADFLYPRNAGHVFSVYDTHVCDEAANVCSIIDVCPTIDVCPIKYDFTVNSQHAPISTSPSVQSCIIDNTFVRVETPDVCPVTDQLAVNSCESEPFRSSPGVQRRNAAESRGVFDSVRQFKLNHSKNLIISHYNVNSIRHKFCEILPLITEFQVDILAIAESKLDDSFPLQQFNISNYKLHRQDRDSRGGGIMIYINDCIPHRLLKDYPFRQIWNLLRLAPFLKGMTTYVKKIIDQ